MGHTTVPATRRPLPEALARDSQHCILGGVNSGTRFSIENVNLVSALGWLYQHLDSENAWSWFSRNQVGKDAGRILRTLHVYAPLLTM